MGGIEINNVSLEWLGHASFKIVHNNVTVYIDPFRIGDAEKADVILVTHEHYDHCSVEDIMKLMKPDTEIIVTPDVTSKLSSRIEGGTVRLVKPGVKRTVKGVSVQAVHAYNIGKPFHPKENEWVGYIVTVNNTKFYHAGDTDHVPEMNSLKADVAMLPVGGTYTMNAEEAARLVNTLKPAVAIPMHYGTVIGSSADAEKFKSLCKSDVRIL